MFLPDHDFITTSFVVSVIAVGGHYTMRSQTVRMRSGISAERDEAAKWWRPAAPTERRPRGPVTGINGRRYLMWHDRSLSRGGNDKDQAGVTMADTQNFPYETRLNVYNQPLQVIDEKALADASTYKWYNQTLCQVNGSVVRLGVVEGEYHWHKHDEDDEFFYVVEGQLLIDLEGRTVELSPRQGFVVPKGVIHRTRARQRTVMLMVENAGIVPTGS